MRSSLRTGRRSIDAGAFGADRTRRIRIARIRRRTHGGDRGSLAGGVIKPSHGTIAIGDFDTRLQPVQARRLCAFASLDVTEPPPAAFDRELRFRAALWRIDEARARAAAA